MDGITVTFTRRNFANLVHYLEKAVVEEERTVVRFNGLSMNPVKKEIYDRATRTARRLHGILCDIYEEDEEDGDTV